MKDGKVRGARNMMYMYSVFELFKYLVKYLTLHTVEDLADGRGSCNLMQICKCFLKRRILLAPLLITLKIMIPKFRANILSFFFPSGLPVNIFGLHHIGNRWLDVRQKAWTEVRRAAFKSQLCHSQAARA